MAPHKPALPEAPFDFETEYARLSERMRTLHISRVEDLPRIELYLDQVLSLVGMELSFIYAPEEKFVTGSMVNNYVKLKIVPAPVRKRYTRRHVAYLVFVCAFKRVLSISQIRQMLSLCVVSDVDAEAAYNALISLFEQTMAALFPPDPVERPRQVDGELHVVDSTGNRVAGELERLLQHAVLLLAYKVYTDRMLDLELRSLPREE